MNIIFFGSDNFAGPSLIALMSARIKISCVVTQPDKKKGRGLHLEGTAIKDIALKAGLGIYQPAEINTAEAVNFLRSLNPDLSVVVAYGQILSTEILNIPKIFSINLHASLLSKYRGAAPINWALIKGEKKTGVSIIKMTKKMDAGPVILQRDIGIENIDSAITLGEKLSVLGAQSLLEALNKIENNNFSLTEQDESVVSFAPKLKKEEGLINWNKGAEEIHNLIRGCADWPGAFSYYNGKLLKIYKARIVKGQSNAAGEVIEASKTGIVISTGKDSLSIEELQLEGGRRMLAGDFVIGHKIKAQERFTKK